MALFRFRAATRDVIGGRFVSARDMSALLASFRDRGYTGWEDLTDHKHTKRV